MEIHEVSIEPCPKNIIAIATNDCVREQHCGIVYTAANGEIKLCDLMWEDRLAVGGLPADYLWVEAKLDADEVSQVAEFIEFIIGKHHRNLPIPYSFVYVRDAFDIAGRLRPGVGLTCATFVIGIFDHFKFYILDLESWLPRPKQDLAFRDRIIRQAEAIPRYAAVADRLKKENPDFRVKPWELWSSATHKRYPVKFRQAIKLTKTMSKLIRRKRPRPLSCASAS